MGIINMMIVMPMIFQTGSFGFIYEKFLGKDLLHAITFAVVLLLIAFLAIIMLIKAVNTKDEVSLSNGGGGH